MAWRKIRKKKLAVAKRGLAREENRRGRVRGVGHLKKQVKEQQVGNLRLQK